MNNINGDTLIELKEEEVTRYTFKIKGQQVTEYLSVYSDFLDNYDYLRHVFGDKVEMILNLINKNKK